METQQSDSVGLEIELDKMELPELVCLLITEQERVAEAEGNISNIKAVLLDRIPRGEAHNVSHQVVGMGEMGFPLEVRHKTRKTWKYNDNQILRLIKEKVQNPAAYIHTEEVLNAKDFELDLDEDPEFRESFGRFVEQKATDYIEVGGMTALLKARGLK